MLNIAIPFVLISTTCPYCVAPVESVITTVPDVIGVPPSAPVSLKFIVKVPFALNVKAPVWALDVEVKVVGDRVVISYPGA